MCPRQPTESGESRQPQPGRERRHDAATIEHADRREIEKIEKIRCPGERDQKGIIKGETERVTRGRGQRTEDPQSAPMDLAVAILGSAATYIRWLVELERTAARSAVPAALKASAG